MSNLKNDCSHDICIQDYAHKCLDNTARPGAQRRWALHCIAVVFVEATMRTNKQTRIIENDVCETINLFLAAVAFIFDINNPKRHHL